MLGKLEQEQQSHQKEKDKWNGRIMVVIFENKMYIMQNYNNKNSNQKNKIISLNPEKKNAANKDGANTINA